MCPAAPRFAAALAFALSCAGCGTAAADVKGAGSAPRASGAKAPAVAAPKPTPPPKVEYLPLAEVAVRLGYKASWEEKKRELTLSNGVRKLVFTRDRREVFCDGRRIFLGDAVQIREGKPSVSKIDYERGLLAIMRPDLAGPLPGPLKIIALDPGHGGNDPGKENDALHLQEKVLTLDVALRLEKLLRAEGYKVVLTRADDRQLGPTKVADLQQRAVIVNQAGADLLVSIHFNALASSPHVGGTETFVFTRPNQRSDQSLSLGQGDDREIELAPVNRFDPWNALLAHSMQGAVHKKLGTSDRGEKTMHSAVLRGVNCPSVLVESVFLSNEAEAKRAATPAYRQQIAEAIADGIRSYAGSLDLLRPKPSPRTATAAPSSTTSSR